MYMFNRHRRYKWPIVALIVAPIHIKLVHSSVIYRWAIYQNTIGVVMHRLVGMGLDALLQVVRCMGFSIPGKTDHRTVLLLFGFRQAQ